MGAYQSTPETRHEDHPYSSSVDPEKYHAENRKGDENDVPREDPASPLICAPKEVINFCRLSMIIHTLCSDATRDVIKHFLGQTNHDITRQILSKSHHFRCCNVKVLPHEKSYFFPLPTSTVEIEKADFSLLYKLLRNFDTPKLTLAEKAKWDKKPNDSDQGVVAALERIRSVRNGFVAHPPSATTEDKEFDDICKTISLSLKAIDTTLGTSHYDRIQEIKNTVLDDSMITTQLKFTETNRKLEETRRKLEALEAVDARTEEELQMLNERLKYWLADREEQMAAIRRDTDLTDDQVIESYLKKSYSEDANQGNTKRFLGEKFRKEKYYVETESFRKARQKLEEKGRIWIVGMAGAGKTRLAVKLLYHFIVKFKGNIVVRKISKPSEIDNHYNANSDKNTILFVDDALGRSVVDRNLARKWCKSFSFINSLCKSVQTTSHLWIVYTSRGYVLEAANNEEVVLLKSIKEFILDLSCEENDLSPIEKKEILEMRIKQTEESGGKLPQLTDKEKETIVRSTPTIGYPLCVKLFVINEENHAHGTDFFECPIEYVVKILNNKLQSEEYKREHYNALEDVILLMLLHNTLRRYDKFGVTPNNIPLHDRRYCLKLAEKFNMFTDLTDDRHLHIRECAKSLSESSLFILERDKDCFDFLHQSIADAVGIYYVKQNFSLAVSTVHIDILIDHISFQGESSEHTGLICINSEAEIKEIIKRFKNEMMQGNVRKVIKHRIWDSNKVCNMFLELSSLKNKENSANEVNYLKTLLYQDDYTTNKKPLISSLEEEKFMLSDSLIQLHKDIDKVEHHGAKEVKSNECHSLELHRLFSEAFLFACAHPDCSSKACNHQNCCLKVLKEMICKGINLDYCKACLLASANEQPNSTLAHQCCLEKAVEKDNSTLVAYLLKNGSTIPHVRWNGWEFLKIAAKCNEVQVCSPGFVSIISSVKDFTRNKRNAHLQKPLTAATVTVAMNYETSDVKVFEKLAHTIHQSGDDKMVILKFFIKNLSVTNEVLMTFESFIELRKEECQKAIFFEIIENEPVVIETLNVILSKPWNFDPNMKNINGRTALTLEARKDCPQKEVINLLLSKGAKPFEVDALRKTFLHYLFASKASDSLVTQILEITELIEIKLPWQQKDENEVTPLSIALTKTANETEISKQRLETLKVISTFKFEQSILCDAACLPFHIIVTNKVLEENKKIHMIDQIANLTTQENTNALLDINARDSNGNTALLEVLNCPSLSMLLFEKLVENGAKTDVYDKYGSTIMHKLLCLDLEPETFKTCIHIMGGSRTCPFDINIKNEQGFTPLLMAVCEKSPISIVNVLLENGASISTENLDGLDAVQMCFHVSKVEYSDYFFELSECLLVHDFDSSKVDSRDRTYVHHCVESCLIDENMASVCERLISKGVDVDKKCDGSLSALHTLLMRSPGNLKTLRVLLEKSNLAADFENLFEDLISDKRLSHGLIDLFQNFNLIHKDCVEKQNVFHRLASEGYKSESEFVDEAVYKQLSLTNSVNHLNEKGLTPLHLACKKRISKKSVQTLILAGADINIRTRERQDSLLHLIVKSDRDDFEAKLLLNLIIDKNKELLNAKNKAGYTPLALAARCERERAIVAHYLTEMGASIAAPDNVEKTPLHHAVSSDKTDYTTFKFVSSLLKKPQSLSAKEEPEQISGKSKRRFRKLDLSKKDNTSDTVLHAVCSVTKFSRILTLTSLLSLADEDTEGLHFDKLNGTPIHRIFTVFRGKEIFNNPVVLLETLMRLSILLLHDVPGDAQDDKGKKYFDYCDMKHLKYFKRIQAAKDNYRFDPPSCQREMTEILREVLETVKYVHKPTITPEEVLYKTDGVLQSGFVDFISTAASYLCEMDFDNLPGDATLYLPKAFIGIEGSNDFVEFFVSENDTSNEDEEYNVDLHERKPSYSQDSDEEFYDAVQEIYEKPVTHAIDFCPDDHNYGKDEKQITVGDNA